jgi:hypothetical protein
MSAGPPAWPDPGSHPGRTRDGRTLPPPRAGLRWGGATAPHDRHGRKHPRVAPEVKGTSLVTAKRHGATAVRRQETLYTHVFPYIPAFAAHDVWNGASCDSYLYKTPWRRGALT